MPTDALLTLIGLIVAVATLLSPERRLDLRIRTGLFDLILVTAVLLLVHLIKFMPVVLAAGVPHLGPWRWGFDADLTSYTLILGAALVLLVRLRRATLKPARLSAFQDLTETLLFAGKFNELLFLLERHLPALRTLVEKGYRSDRLRETFRPPAIWETIGVLAKPSARSSSAAWWRPIGWHIVQWLPDHGERRLQAQRLLDRLFLSIPFVAYLSTARPYFALEVLRIDTGFARGEYLKAYLRSLFNNEHSALYEEVRQCQSLRPDGGYVIEPLNPILYFFFGGESFKAEELALYKPVGDLVADDLTSRRYQSSDQYRTAVKDFVDGGKWRSNVFVALRLFDYMITEGLRRGCHWHLWLMYLEYWTEDIVQNLGGLPDEIDLSREFPTAYHYLLYEIFDTLRGWVKLSATLDSSIQSVAIDAVDLEPGSIAKSAALALGHCLRIALESPNLSAEFKGYLLEMVLRGHHDIVASENKPLIEVYELAVLSGSRDFGDSTQYREAIRDVLPIVDQVPFRMSSRPELLDALEALAEGA